MILLNLIVVLACGFAFATLMSVMAEAGGPPAVLATLILYCVVALVHSAQKAKP